MPYIKLNLVVAEKCVLDEVGEWDAIRPSTLHISRGALAWP